MSKTGDPWDKRENDLIVGDYFVMLKAELEGRRYNKTKHREELRKQVKRTPGAIEFKHQNISAVLQDFGAAWINGYKPLKHVQPSLIKAVRRWVDNNPGWIEIPFKPPSATPLKEELVVEQPPKPQNKPQREKLDSSNQLAIKLDVAERDKLNRALGLAGEICVLAHELAVLANAGKHSLVDRVRWVSQEDGDGLGYDIASVSPDGKPRLIEVKTTRGAAHMPFFITPRELEVSEEKHEEWCLFRLWGFPRQLKAFELYPPLEDHVLLSPANYRASFQ